MKDTTYSTGILQYIPFLYVIWADDLLSASEIAVVMRAIKEDSLTKEEKSQIENWLNTKKPPADETIKYWKTLIDKSHIKLVESDSYPLSAFSQKFANELTRDTVPELNSHLQSIEINLGIQPNHYHHLFDVEIIQEKSSNLYDAQKIDELLKGENAGIINQFRAYLNHPVFKWEIVRNKDEFRNKVLGQVKYLAENGYGALAYPPQYGGTGNMVLYGNIFENLIYVDGSLAVKFGVQFGLFGGSVYNLGTQIHHDKYLADTGKANLLGCFAMTETKHGSNVRGIKTTATYIKETDHIIIDTPGTNDNKEYIGNALHSSIATVFAQLIVNGKNEGVHAILVPLRDEKHNLLPGITIEDNGYKLGLNGVDNGKIWFKNVSVPRENLLNKFGSIDNQGNYQSSIKSPNRRFFTMLGTLVGGRICVAKGALSGAKMSLAIAVKYALNRRQFNNDEKMQEELIMDYPTHQLRLIVPLAQSYVYHFALEDMLKQYANANEEERRKIETQAAALKACITWFANNTIQQCREACGGKGYLLENRIADLKNDIDIFTTFEGDNTVLLQLAAKGILTDFKKEFNNDNIGDTLKFISTQVTDTLITFNPLFTNKYDKEHLFDHNFHQEAFQYHTRRLTFSAAMRLRGFIKKGLPPSHSFLKVQTHLVALGKAYATQLSYELFNKHIQNIPDENLKSLFSKTGTLYALNSLYDNAAWYLEHGYISANKSKAIRQRIERLCTELRPHVNVLIDGFGIPEQCLTSPIYKNDRQLS
ncbi:acyl-CoA dehydrogenase family protein [Abyssalbus ytuae]|uniref:acyl-CoA oxidase n=1 Tax=Abyssalbus ytuae TaxID=2926907 RepID=A0A9E6ZR19_9FLAO|nr:acyl-CoA dehydrogenase [Abyssalbus ytuae]UOB18990.1 acyl-CoA dehydrogenase family protein [Abyssalbus ytuae]